MSGSATSPLAQLVLFMICLSIAGSFVAGMHYAFIDHPQQENIRAPSNDWLDYCTDCTNYCTMQGQPSDICMDKCCSP